MRNLLFVVCLLAMPCVSRAQNSEASWETLHALRAGEKIEVVETTLKNHKGTLVTSSEESITLRESGAEQTIKKENVTRVTRLEKTHRLRNALIFGAVGAGVGAGIGAAAVRCHPGDIVCGRGVVAAVGGVVGLLGGLAIGTAVPSHDTIYRNKPH
jgi:thiamine pyrophosphate-dependent acetolactate synthase large subunit-like protein